MLVSTINDFWNLKILPGSTYKNQGLRNWVCGLSYLMNPIERVTKPDISPQIVQY